MKEKKMREEEVEKKKKRKSGILSDEVIEATKNFASVLKKELENNKGVIKRSFLLKVAALLCREMKNRTFFSQVCTTFFEFSERKENAYMEHYIKSVYFSGDYKKFLKTKPVDVVRMMRFYFRKKDGVSEIPIYYAPYLLKRARVIKKSIMNTIRYHLRKNPFIPDYVIYEELKEEYLGKRKITRIRKRRRRRKVKKTA